MLSPPSIGGGRGQALIKKNGQASWSPMKREKVGGGVGQREGEPGGASQGQRHLKDDRIQVYMRTAIFAVPVSSLTKPIRSFIALDTWKMTSRCDGNIG